MSKPTPGPWIKQFGNRQVIQEGGKPVADCSVGDSLEAEANARLITAAPDLLEACRHIFYREWKLETNREKEDYEILDKAIAKAEGGER